MEDQTTARGAIPCTICGVPSRGRVYGAIACQACKLFFRRNGPRGLPVFQCHSDGHCAINILTRHSCAYCRLVKCFAKGMQIELIRCSRSASNNVNDKRKARDDEVQIVSIVSVRRIDPVEFPTLNLLRTDHSTLTIDQWNLLSNLSNCFDHYFGMSIGERYMTEQNNLPPKFRFKSSSIMQLYGMFIDRTQSLYTNNADFLRLRSDDRSSLLHSTLSHVVTMTTNYMTHKIELTHYETYFDAVEILTNKQIASVVRRVSSRLDFDLVVFKLLVAIFSFSTYKCIGYSTDLTKNLTNIQEVRRIQDAYTEVTWRYLVYKYGHQQAVKCFSNFIRYALLINDVLAISQEVEWFNSKLDSLEKKTEQSFSLHN